jgi:hypothetical protein
MKKMNAGNRYRLIKKKREQEQLNAESEKNEQPEVKIPQ